MSKITIELSPQEIQEAFGQLPVREKVKLVSEFERQTRKERWDDLLARIDARRKKYPISQKEINRVCEEVRKERYAQRTESRH